MPENQNSNNYQQGSGADYARRMRTEKAKKVAREDASIGVLIAKAALGILLIAGGFIVKGSSGSIAIVLIGLFLGFFLVIWGIAGYLQHKKRIEDAKLDVILSEPMNTYGNAEIQDLQAKYDEPAGATGAAGNKDPNGK